MSGGAAAVGLAASSILQIGGAIYQTKLATQRAESQKRALELRRQQIEVASKRETIKTMREANSVIARQVAQGAARGIALSSPSFQAISQDTLREFQKDEDANALNLGFNELAINQGIRDVDFATKVEKKRILFDTAKSLLNSATAAAGGGLGSSSGSSGTKAQSQLTGGAVLQTGQRLRTSSINDPSSFFQQDSLFNRG